jgi:hypothetical protein
MSSPAHIELIAEQKVEEVVKEKDESAKSFKPSKKQIAQSRSKAIKIGGGI